MFKEGERIRCLDNSFSELKKDNYYTVMFTTGGGMYVSLLEQRDSSFNQYHHSYFTSVYKERNIKINKIKDRICVNVNQVID